MEVQEISLQTEVLEFLSERLKYYLKAEGFEYDLIMASLNNNANNINIAIKRLKELQEYFGNKGSSILLSSIKRIINIIANNKVSLEVDESILIEVEIALLKKVRSIDVSINHLESLIEPIDNFFENVLINDPNEKIRNNRLNILYNVLVEANKVADFSKIEG